MFTVRSLFARNDAQEDAQQLPESVRPLLVHLIDGSPVDVDLTRAYSVAEVREMVAVAVGVDTQPSEDTHVGIRLLSGGCDVGDGIPLDSLDRDLGLVAILVHEAPAWYPKDKYMYNDQEVLQIAMTGDNCFAQFVNGSSQQVDRALYQKALQEWKWQEVSLQDRSWAHPSEKPKESGGWTDFMAGVMTSRNAVRGAGAVAGFFVGVTGNLQSGHAGNGDFGTSFQVAQCVGLVIYGVISLVRFLPK